MLEWVAAKLFSVHVSRASREIVELEDISRQRSDREEIVQYVEDLANCASVFVHSVN